MSSDLLFLLILGGKKKGGKKKGGKKKGGKKKEKKRKDTQFSAKRKNFGVSLVATVDRKKKKKTGEVQMEPSSVLGGKEKKTSDRGEKYGLCLWPSQRTFFFFSCFFF